MSGSHAPENYAPPTPVNVPPRIVDAFAAAAEVYADPKKRLTPEQTSSLKAPLPASEMFKAPLVVDRFNDVFGIDGWEIKNVIVEKTPVVILAVFTAAEYGVRREAFGGGIADATDRANEYKGACDAAIVKIGLYLGVGTEIYKKLDPSLAGGAPGQRSQQRDTPGDRSIRLVQIEKIAVRTSSKKDSFLLITCRAIANGSVGQRVKVQCWQQQFFELLRSARTAELRLARERKSGQEYLKVIGVLKVNDKEVKNGKVIEPSTNNEPTTAK